MEWVLQVPCSTSNLGPGFDFMGLALGKYLDLRFGLHGDDGEISVEWQGGPKISAADDLLVKAMRAVQESRGTTLPGVRITANTAIPVGRGFGSSGASVAAGLLIAEAVLNPASAVTGLTVDQRKALVTECGLALEGHPDNVTASMLGGCTLSVPHDAGLAVVQTAVAPSLRFAIAWPNEPLFTSEAREVLPERVTLEDAIENPRRLALLLEGLRTGDGELLRLGAQDRLHERYRRPLIKGSEQAMAGALDAGAFAATLSGAGSGLVAIAPEAHIEGVKDALYRTLEKGPGSGCAVVPYVSEAPTVKRARLGDA